MTLWQREHMCSLKTTCCFLGNYKRSLLSFLELKKNRTLSVWMFIWVFLFKEERKTENLHLLVSMRSSLIMVRRPAADCPPMHTTPDTTTLRFGFRVESDMRLLSRDEGCCVGQ